MEAETIERVSEYLANDYQMTLDEYNNLRKKKKQKIFSTISYKLLTDKNEEFLNRYVWFTIQEFGSGYTITIFYENGYNNPHGEDL